MIIVTGELRVAPENIERLRPAMRAVLETSRREPGVFFMPMARTCSIPVWCARRALEDATALAAHDKAAHVAAWRAALKEVGVVSRELWAHEGSNGRPI